MCLTLIVDISDMYIAFNVNLSFNFIRQSHQLITKVAIPQHSPEKININFKNKFYYKMILNDVRDH